MVKVKVTRAKVVSVSCFCLTSIERLDKDITQGLYRISD